MEIAVLLALILRNGCFAMSEIALVTARKARPQKLINDGNLLSSLYDDEQAIVRRRRSEAEWP